LEQGNGRYFFGFSVCLSAFSIPPPPCHTLSDKSLSWYPVVAAPIHRHARHRLPHHMDVKNRRCQVLFLAPSSPFPPTPSLSPRHFPTHLPPSPSRSSDPFPKSFPPQTVSHSLAFFRARKPSNPTLPRGDPLHGVGVPLPAPSCSSRYSPLSIPLPSSFRIFSFWPEFLGA
jgi:hypothetical protein